MTQFNEAPKLKATTKFNKNLAALILQHGTFEHKDPDKDYLLALADSLAKAVTCDLPLPGSGGSANEFFTAAIVTDYWSLTKAAVFPSADALAFDSGYSGTVDDAGYPSITRLCLFAVSSVSRLVCPWTPVAIRCGHRLSPLPNKNPNRSLGTAYSTVSFVIHIFIQILFKQLLLLLLHLLPLQLPGPTRTPTVQQRQQRGHDGFH